MSGIYAYLIFDILVTLLKKVKINDSTKYINHENVYTNEQLENIIKKLSKHYRPKRVIIYESRLDLLRYLLISPTAIYSLLDVRVLVGIIGGTYFPVKDEISMFLFTFKNKKFDDVDKVLYFAHSFVHELRHRWQKSNNVFYKIKREKDANNFAHYFLNRNSALISKTLNLADEWYCDEPLVK